MKPRVLVVGSGAREHALALRMRAGGSDVLVAPGNAGTAKVARNLPVAADCIEELVARAVAEKIDLVIVGPELPLTLGIVDAMNAQGIVAFGPSREAARLEGSKVFMKRFLLEHGIPTAACQIFDDADKATAYARNAKRPLVVKADGLAGGKGVTVAQTAGEAVQAIEQMMRARLFGDAGRAVIIEEVLPGEEASFHVVCDGERCVPLVPAQDHKRVGDGDRGANTGGMGAYAPAPIVTGEVHARVMETIVKPTLTGMAQRGAPFRGALFVGLMIENGIPRVLEFNVRFGDPETCVLLPLYEGDLFRLFDRAARGALGDLASERAIDVDDAAIAVVMAADGYPGAPKTGDVIAGLDTSFPNTVSLLHAGTKTREDGAVVTAGGRVLVVTAHDESLQAAARVAYASVSQIDWDGEHHRTDIGHRALPGM